MQCKACLYSTNHPFGLTLEDDICSGCITHDEKYHIDWQQKNLELKKIAHWAKKKSRTYDCVIPVIGDAEDYFVVSKVLELALSPLTTVFYFEPSIHATSRLFFMLCVCFIFT